MCPSIPNETYPIQLSIENDILHAGDSVRIDARLTIEESAGELVEIPVNTACEGFVASRSTVLLQAGDLDS